MLPSVYELVTQCGVGSSQHSKIHTLYSVAYKYTPICPLFHVFKFFPSHGTDGSTLYIGIAMVFVFSPYILKVKFFTFYSGK